MKEQINKLIQISRYSYNVLRQLSDRQSSYPEGNIQIERKNNKVNYYQYFGDNTSRKYLNKSQTSLIATLAQKKYDLQAFNVIKARKDVLDQCITKLKNVDQKYSLTKIYENFPQELKPLITPILSYDEAYAKRWQAVKHEKSTYPMEPIYKSKRGEYVRSKIELIIADKLFDAGVPYHYEAALKARNRIISYPDFLVLNTRTGKEYYWEHFGMMSDPEYLVKTLNKIETYAHNGFFLGENIIATFEGGNYPICTSLLDKIITTFLK